MAGIVRFLFAIMLCIANMIIYGLKVNISTAIIGMVKSKEGEDSSGASNECPQYDNEKVSTTTSLGGSFEWSSTEQGLVVSLYFAGYMIGMFPCGYFADRFNTKWVLLICVFLNAIFTLLVPIAASEISVLFALRFLTGLVSAANLPIVNVLVSKWVVYEEKSLWVGIIFSGTSLGTVISILTTGMIMSYLGWKAVFYIHGILPLIWCAVFMVFFADNPETQKYISEEERNFLCQSYGHRSPSATRIKVPWKSIFTSIPFWALVMTNTLGNFCWYFLLTQLPIYMSKMLRFNIKSNAEISCVPYLLNAIANPLLGRMLDWGRKKNYWTQTGARKIAVTISCVPPSIILLIIAYIGCARVTTTILLCISIVICGAIFVGHLCNQNDLAPNYAGILMGITNTPGTISAFILPALVGRLMTNGHTFARWQYVFWLNIVAQMLSWIIFLIFGSAKIQDWNYSETEPTEEREAKGNEAVTTT